MTTYQIIDSTRLLHTADGAVIPVDPANADYQAYTAWLAAGNTPDPASPPPVAFAAPQNVDAKVRTTDATPTELYRLPLTLLTGYAFVTTLIGVDAGTGAVRGVRSSSAYKRLNAGALQVGSTVVIANHTDAGASAWVLAAAVSGNDVVVTVTGVAAHTIDWSLTGSVMRFSPGGLS